MLLRVLKKRFNDTKFDGWQGYMLLDLPDGEDPREGTFKRLKATVDFVPAALRDRAEQFLVVNPAWFDEVVKDLCEEVGWDFFPENAACFVTRLIERLKASSPESTWRWRQPEPELGLDFAEPYPST